MCRMKSMILLKDSVFCPNYDEHSKMLEALKIKDDNIEPNFVKIEIVPKASIFEPIETWKYIVDQDYLPNWYVQEIDEPRCRKALAEWTNQHIKLNTDFGFIEKNDYLNRYYLNNCSGNLYNNSNDVLFIDTCKQMNFGHGFYKISNSDNLYVEFAFKVKIKNSSRIRTYKCLEVWVENSAISALHSVVYASKGSKVYAGRHSIIFIEDSTVELIGRDETATIINTFKKESD